MNDLSNQHNLDEEDRDYGDENDHPVEIGPSMTESETLTGEDLQWLGTLLQKVEKQQAT